MKKIMTTVAMAASLTMGGCFLTTGGAPPPSVSDVVAQVQQYTRAACSFAPVGQVVAQVIASAVPAGAVAVPIASIGSAICQAYLAASPQTLGRRVVRAKIVGGLRVTPGAVNGIPIL